MSEFSTMSWWPVSPQLSCDAPGLLLVLMNTWHVVACLQQCVVIGETDKWQHCLMNCIDVTLTYEQTVQLSCSTFSDY